jgi:hypothetical protein
MWKPIEAKKKNKICLLNSKKIFGIPITITCPKKLWDDSSNLEKRS